jgi:hypothetical protein
MRNVLADCGVGVRLDFSFRCQIPERAGAINPSELLKYHNDNLELT